MTTGFHIGGRKDRQLRTSGVEPSSSFLFGCVAGRRVGFGRVLTAVLTTVMVVSGCREEREGQPLRRPVAEREYREVDALEWRALTGSESEFSPYLSSAWPRVRARAVVAFARANGGRDPELLLKRWKVEDDAKTRAEIVFALRRFEGARVLSVLESASEDEELGVRQAVATALRDVDGSRGLAEKLAQDEDPSVRRRAVLSLALSGQSERRFWTERLVEEGDQSVRWALYAGIALEPRLARDLTSALVAGVGDQNFLVGVFALKALRRLEQIGSEGADRDRPGGDRPGRTAGGLATILEVAGNPGVFWIQREAAVHALAVHLLYDHRLPDEERRAIESLLLELARREAFSGEPLVLRQRLVRSLCAVRDPAVAPRLRELASASSIGLRIAVADGLADVLSAPRALRDLSPDRASGAPRPDMALRAAHDSLRTDAHAGVRAAAARVGDDDGQPAAWALADSSPRVRMKALEAARLPLSPSVISQALRDSDAGVRRVALECLWKASTSVDLDQLRRAAEDPSPWQWSSRLPALDFLRARHPEESQDLLEAALRDPSPVIARHALALGRPAEGRKLVVPDDFPARASLVPSFPLVHRDPIRARRRPRVIVGVEGKEPFVLELYADEAPLHVSSFLALAQGGYYTGARVGGIDIENGAWFRREGNARHPLVGQALRPEGSLLPLARGTLISLPVYRRDGELWDAVGEWQITLLPRPDLRGRATGWGRVHAGMHVVDRLAPEDRIASIEIVD